MKDFELITLFYLLKYLNLKEGFGNPCLNGQIYYPAHSSLPPNYFIECSQMLPYLMKCAPYTQWNQEILTCDWARGSYRSSTSRNQPAASIQTEFGQTNNYNQQAINSIKKQPILINGKFIYVILKQIIKFFFQISLR